MAKGPGRRAASVAGAMAVIFTLCGGMFQQAAVPNFVAYHPLDELALGTVTDAVAAFDGAHADNPTIQTAASEKAPVLFNNPAALSFTSGIDRVTLPNTLVNGRTNLTATWWMKTSKTTGTHAIVSGAASDAANNEYLLFFQTTTVFRYHDKGAFVEFTFSPAISSGTWRHVALVRDDTNNQVTLYIDGTSIGTLAMTINGALAIAANGLVVGEEQDTVGGTFDANQSLVGGLDDLRFYDRVLTAAEAAYLAAGNGIPAAPTMNAPTVTMAPTFTPEVNLTWSAVTGPTTYTVTRGTTAGGPYPTTVATGITGTTFTDTTTVFGTTYYYVVTAVNVGGTSAPSNEVSVTPQPPPPRTNDHDEGLFDGKCACGAAPAAAVPALAWAAALLAALLGFRRRAGR